MSSQIQTVSKLTLLKVASNISKCQVFCQINRSLQKFEISVDESTSVQAIIKECIILISKAQKSSELHFQVVLCELYASKKSGRKISDLPSLQSQQKISKTGLKSFYLQYSQKQNNKRATCYISTNSIQSEIKIEKKRSAETKTLKEVGCFCF